MRRELTLTPLLSVFLWLFVIPSWGQTIAGPTAPTRCTSACSNLVVSNHPAKLLSLVATTGASAGFFMVFDATSAPGDGAVAPAYCWSTPATTTLAGPWPFPAVFSTGITVVFSTGADCYNKTASATAFISGQVQ